LDDQETGRSIADNIVEQGVTATGKNSTKFRGVQFATRRFKATGDLMFRVGVQGGAVTEKSPEKNRGAKTPHWRLLELGTETIPAKGIMRNALESNSEVVGNTFVSEFNKAIDRAIKKAGKAVKA
jgi:HK97 gp10 family phage protein